MEVGLHSTRSPSMIMIRVGSIRPPSIVRMPSPRGSVNRFGPAEPGLNRRVDLCQSVLDWWVWPKTQMSGRSRSNKARPSFVSFPPLYRI